MQLVRIFVSSPGDCAQERALLDEAVERINRSELDRSGILLRTFAWEHDVVPRIGPPPQTVVDEQTPLCDVYIGIMSGRFGGDGTRESGTEQEFRDALTRYGDSGKPWILFYFNDQPLVPSKKEAAQEWATVLAFREELESKGIVGTYAGARGSATGFFETIELHLRTLLQRPEFQPPASQQAALASRSAPRMPATPVVPPPYLAWLQSKCAGIDLLGLEPKHGSAARLQSIYVPLTTGRSLEDLAELETEYAQKVPPESVPDAVFQRPILLLDRFANQSLYISGAPGSGKSVFCRWVTLLACTGQLPVTNLVYAPDGYQETWPGVLSGRLPILVRLRECWHALPPRPGSRELSRRDFEHCLASWVASNSDGLDDAEQVLAHLAAGSAIVVLDGVDEVPVVHDKGRAEWFPRALLLSGLGNASRPWTAAGNRVLLTSRPHGLTADTVSSLGLAEARLLEFDAPLRRLLIDRWFQQLRPGEEGIRYATDLAAHLAEHRWLEPLSVNPLLLTGMCIVFDEGGRLPQDKHELYARIVNTVLNSRYRDDVEGRERARYRLQAIAHSMHTGHGLGEARRTPEADVSYQDLDRILREYLDKSTSKEEGNTTTVAAREELLSQSGLFLGRGDNTAGFYHLSFQEFLAGQRLADLENELLPVFLERAESPEWHNTLSLLFASLTREKAARLVSRMVDAFGTRGPRVQQVASDCLDILLARGVRLDGATEQTCRDAFLTTMLSKAPTVIRLRVGSTLGRLGDPRFHDEHLWCLPKDPMLGFVEIPAGSFTMGNDRATDRKSRPPERPLHRVSLPAYLMARYPVTVAQFEAFAAANPNVAGRGMHGVSNHAVVNVSWKDAIAYCGWLDACLRATSGVPEPLMSWLGRVDDWRVSLLSEAEWEQVARDQARQSSSLFPEVTFDYPVGMYPSVATLVTDGPVEELNFVPLWTRSRWQPYPYIWNDGREDLEPGWQARVVRGGSRLAQRTMLFPDKRAPRVGFRLAISRRS